MSLNEVFDSQLSLLGCVRDAVITSPGQPETVVSDVDLQSERGVVYFTYMRVRFRVTDRWEVEEQGCGEVGYGVGAASLLFRSLLRHRGALLEGLRGKGGVV